MIVREALLAAEARIAATSDSPRLDAEILLAGLLGLSRTQLLLSHDDALDDTRRAAFFAQVERRAGGEPVAYLTGQQGFWSLDLKVTPDVLVPRPETELLVEWALELLVSSLPQAGERTALHIADLGTGSGAIALALARERPQARVIATDASAAALAVAAGNARELGIANVEFRAGSWYVPLAGESFDLIVSNPPYIAAGDPHLPALRHEPTSALTDGSDGLSCLREIVAAAPRHLSPGGWLLVEHGYDQGEAVRALFAAAGLRQVGTRRDLGGQERCTGGWRA